MDKLNVESVLGENGLLSKRLKGYEYRPQQMQMARGVEQALKDNAFYVVEAATGTGKTMAYAIPSILAEDKTVVISTGTKALQDQLTEKDIPFLRENLPTHFKAVQLKGFSNYLCLRKYNENVVAEQQSLIGEDEKHFKALIKWVNNTRSGQISELTSVPENSHIWRQVTTSSFGCTKKACPQYQDCFVTKSRSDAADADIVIVNHHLFLLDAAIRYKFGNEASVLPNFDTVIFDEAHHLVDVATSCFSHEFAANTITSFMAEIQEVFSIEGESFESEANNINSLLKDASNHAQKGLGILRPEQKHKNDYGGRVSIDQAMTNLGSDQLKNFTLHFDTVEEDLEAASRELSKLAKLYDVFSGPVRRIDGIMESLRHIKDIGNNNYAQFIDDSRGTGATLIASPVDVSNYFRKYVWDRLETAIFTSATLAADSKVTTFTDHIGLDSDLCRNLGKKAFSAILPPVFDYPSQSALYIPRDMPNPNDEGFRDAISGQLMKLVDIVGGRAFFLFTSNRNLNALYDDLAHRLKYRVFKQGDMPKGEIVRQFKAEPQSVLFATSSFWEGVDVPGEALQLVVLDKLPFDSHLDPLVKARGDWIDSQGGSAFMDLSLPSAAIKLKQGFGRLIRTKHDIGIVSILDSRIWTKRYGKYFLKSLPPAARFDDVERLERWWKEKAGSAVNAGNGMQGSSRGGSSRRNRHSNWA